MDSRQENGYEELSETFGLLEQMGRQGLYAHANRGLDSLMFSRKIGRQTSS